MPFFLEDPPRLRTPRDSIAKREPLLSVTVRSLTGRLMAMAHRFTGDEELARDAVQEAFLSLWLEAELPPNPRAWLYRTVRHRCLHLIRGRSRRLRHEARARSICREASDRDDPIRLLEREEGSRILSQALDRLPADQRRILALSSFDELDYRSIASVLEIPLGTVRSRLNRARQALRHQLLSGFPVETDAWRTDRIVGADRARKLPSSDRTKSPEFVPIPA